MQVKIIEQDTLLHDQQVFKIQLQDQFKSEAFDSLSFLIAKIPEFSKHSGNINSQISSFSRELLALALSSLGSQYHFSELSQNDQLGAPVIPAPYVASLSHSQTHTAVIASTNSNFQAFGIDLEQATRKVNPKIQSRIAFDDELKFLLPYFSLNESLLRIFSAKEAIYKYMYNLNGGLLGFRDVRLEWQNEDQYFVIHKIGEKAVDLDAQEVYLLMLFEQLISVVL